MKNTIGHFVFALFLIAAWAIGREQPTASEDPILCGGNKAAWHAAPSGENDRPAYLLEPMGEMPPNRRAYQGVSPRPFC
jgi:hypothetical protein